MNSSKIKIVEIKCRHNSFEDSTEDVQNIRHLLRSYPSNIIQTRITFDALCAVSLSDLQPLALQRLQSLKSDLIDILQNGGDDSYFAKD